MIKINLLPVRAEQKKEKLREQLIVFVVALGVVVAGAAISYTTVMAKVITKKGEIEAQNQELQRLDKVIGEVKEVEKLQKSLQEKLDVLDRLKANKAGPVHLLDELSLATPEKLWFDSFKEEEKTITITGIGLNEETVAQFMSRLEASPYYRGIELKVVEKTDVAGTRLQKFTVICQKETAPAPAPGTLPAAAPAPSAAPAPPAAAAPAKP